jgi:hypothetical protein
LWAVGGATIWVCGNIRALIGICRTSRSLDPR